MFRIAFGLLFLLAGWAKVSGGYGSFADGLVLSMGESFPEWLLLVYGYILPAVEIIVGICLLINKKTKLAYQVVGAIYLSFILGQQIAGNTGAVGAEYLPSLLALVVGYYLYNKRD